MLRSVDEVHNTNYDPSDVIAIIKSADSNFNRQKFILSLKFILDNKPDIGYKLLRGIKQLDTCLFIDSCFIESLLINHQATSLSFAQTFHIIDFILAKASHRESFKMAIHQHLMQYAQTANLNTSNLDEVLMWIGRIKERVGDKDMTVDLLQMLYSNLLNKLAEVPVPRETEYIQQHKLDTNVIVDFFQSLSNRLEVQSMLFVVKTVYEKISRDQDVSPLTYLGLAVIPEEMVPNAVSLMFRSNNLLTQRKAIITAVNRLIKWQKMIAYNVPLHLWIVKVLYTLHEEKQYDILEEIIVENIIQCFLMLVVPVFQARTFIVVQAMLELQRSETVFNLLVPRFYRALLQLEQTDSEIFEPMLDLISDYVGYFPEASVCKDTIGFLRDHQRSPSRRYKYSRMPLAASMRNNARTGLENLGNTCYINSVVQALFMTKQFCRELLILAGKDDEITVMQKIFALLLFSNRPELNLKFAMSTIRPADFLPGIQHDSTEFMASLLDKLHEADKKFLNTAQDWKEADNDDSGNIEPAVKLEDVNMDEVKKEDDTDDSGCEELSTEPLDKVTDNTTELNQSTIVHKIFGGKMSTTCVCSSCKSKSIVIDSFRDIALSFPEKKNDDDWDAETQYSVQELLNFYFSSEQLTLDLDNQYSCEKCKSLCDGIRLTELLQPPKNLILTLKHFRYDSRYHTRSKLLINKMFHDEEISVNVRASHEANNIRPVNYRLYAAVVHSGVSLDSGHYYTFAREDNDMWFKFNDNFVSKSTLQELRTLNSPNTPYILFYRRISTASSTASSSSAESLAMSDDTTPSLEELPLFLKKYVNEDNDAFEKESKRFNFQTNKSVSNTNRWNDDDPPSSCGSNFDVQHNRFIC